MHLSKVLAEKEKNQEIISVNKDFDIKKVAEILCTKKIGAALITDSANADDNEKKYIGIVTEKDIIRAICKYPELSKIKITEICSKEMIVGKLTDKVSTIMNVMSEKKIRHIPVVDDTEIVGLVSIGDIIKSISKEDELKIRHLSDIVGGVHSSKVF